MQVFDLRDPTGAPWRRSVALIDGHTWNPDHVLAAYYERQAPAFPLRYLAVDQQILDSAAFIPAQGADSIPGPATANRQTVPELVW
jgi:hypothetical protein